MMMNSPQDNTPDELKGIVEVLEKSLSPQEAQPVPPLPDDLRERLRGQYTEAVTGPVESGGLLSRIWAVVAQPAFSGAFAAFVLVAVLGSLFLKNRSIAPEQMRGASPAEVAPQTILVLFELAEDQQAALRESGYFEPALLQVAVDEAALGEIVARDGESLVIDGRAGELRREDGASAGLPAESGELADAVLELLGS